MESLRQALRWRAGLLSHEPQQIEERIRKLATGGVSSPKLWMDTYLTAFAARTGAVIVTFDRALAARSEGSLLLE